MRWLVFVFGLIVLSFLTGCGGGGGATPVSGENNPPSPPYNIYGKVSDLSGRAISGATVSAYYKDDLQQTILDSSTTDAQGQYHLWVPVVVGKTYEIKAEKDGYQSATKEIQFSPSAPPQEVNFTLTPNKR